MRSTSIGSTHMLAKLIRIVSVCSSLVATSALGAAADTREARGVHAAGAPVALQYMPKGKLRSDLEALSFKARQNALQRLGRLQFPWADTVGHLRADAAGNLYYEDRFAGPRTRRPGVRSETGAPASVAKAVAPINIASVFKLHSKSGAARRVYLNFRGETVSGTGWNAQTGFVHPMKPFSLDSNLGAVSQQEANAIAEIWKNVSEDFAPFDIDVTTERPASFGPQTGHILISPRMDANGRYIVPEGPAGIAFLDVWGQADYAYYQPALVFPEQVYEIKDISEVASHEFGHNLALTHDGRTSPSEEYFGGHGSGNTSWGPIMGTGGYNHNVSQWSKGEYANANNPQDDIAVIGSRLDFRVDDHSNRITGATALRTLNGVVPTFTLPDRPANTWPFNKGIINSRSDVDVFYFEAAAAGTVKLKITPDWLDTFTANKDRSANLDVVARLYNNSGKLIAASNAPADTDAVITAAVPVGRYFLAIDGGGAGSVRNDGYSDYASLGRYYIEGTIPFPRAGLVQFSAPTYGIKEGNASVSLTLTRSSKTDSGSVNFATANGTAASGTDYAVRRGTVSFPAGVTRKTITVPILDGAVAESPENFRVILSNPVGVGLGSVRAATVTITDNDVPTSTVAFGEVSYAVTEGTAAVSLTVTRTTAIGTALVNFATVSVSAGAGSDYTAKQGTIAFAAGETTKTIVVPIVNDSVAEGPESFNVKLSSPTGVGLGSPSVATVNIDDDDVPPATIAFGAATYSVSEGTAGVDLTLTRSSGIGTGSVIYSTQDVSAVSGSDYTAKSETVTFAAGETSKVITVPIINDDVLEGAESFRVNLSSPVGATLGSPSSATVTVDDDDPSNVVVLANGVEEAGLSGATGSARYFSITVPPGAANLTISTTNGTGDADLSVKLGSLPTLSSFDCSPMFAGNIETCSAAAPLPGTYYIMLYGYSEYSGVSLTASYTATTPLANGVAAAGLSGAAVTQTFYSIEVPAGATNLQIATSNGTGDVDLYVKLNQLPSTSTWDCRPFTTGNNESCSWPAPTPGRYFIALDGYDAYSGVTLLASYGGAAAPAARNAPLLASGKGATR